MVTIESCTSIFQVREARTHSCALFVLLFYFHVENLWLVCYSECVQWCDVLFGLVGAAVPGKPVAMPVNLA